MDAGKWAEAEPREDGGPDGGWAHRQWSGKLSVIWGVNLTAKGEVRSLGIHLDPALTMETQVGSVGYTAFFSSLADSSAVSLS